MTEIPAYPFNKYIYHPPTLLTSVGCAIYFTYSLLVNTIPESSKNHTGENMPIEMPVIKASKVAKVIIAESSPPGSLMAICYIAGSNANIKAKFLSLKPEIRPSRKFP